MAVDVMRMQRSSEKSHKFYYHATNKEIALVRSADAERQHSRSSFKADI